MERVKPDQKLDQKLSTDGLWIECAVIFRAHLATIPPLPFHLSRSIGAWTQHVSTAI
jgi:hypothetical protein